MFQSPPIPVSAADISLKLILLEHNFGASPSILFIFSNSFSAVEKNQEEAHTHFTPEKREAEGPYEEICE